MSGPKRIITIASGKGGVGKTTLAINYSLALSQYGKTVLFDFDFETGSVRSFLEMKFPKDLYHFFLKDAPLPECITPISRDVDPQGRFSNLGIIAAPKHFMEDFTHFKRASQHKLIQAIHKLDAEYVIIDMKAGLDTEILDFLPYSNSGILIFTPRLLAATSAAAYLVKAQIFRKLQIFYSPSSPIVQDLSTRDQADLFDLIHRADDVYDDEVPNLDKVYSTLKSKFGQHPVTTAMARVLGTFQIHYVLNHFTGVEESYKRAVEPFAQAVAEIVSARLRLRNLGWVQYSSDIHDANCQRLPVMLGGAEVKKAAQQQDRKIQDALLELENLAGTLMKAKPLDLEKTKPGLDRYLADQLTQLESTYGKLGKRSHVDNFNYIAAASIHLMKTERPYHFGDVRILEPRDLQQLIMNTYKK